MKPTRILVSVLLATVLGFIGATVSPWTVQTAEAATATSCQALKPDALARPINSYQY